MKYIISEELEIRLSILRRINGEDWDLILEIVDEGLDNDDPCDFRDYDRYLKRICADSARTYLFHYYDNEYSNDYKVLFKYLCRIIWLRMGDDIKEYYEDKKEDC